MNIKLYKYEHNNFTLQAIIDDIQQASFEHNLYQAGQFTITINYNIPNAKLFKRGLFVQFGDSPYDFGEIYSVTNTISDTGKGSEYLNITGYDARYIFKRRVILELNNEDVWSMTADGETCLRSLIDSQMIGARKLPVINTYNATTLGKTYTVSEAYTNLYDVLVTIATQSEIGWRLKFINTALILEVYNGTDRSSNVFFTTNFDSLKNGNYQDTNESYCNIVYVGGQGQGANRDIYQGMDANADVGFLKINSDDFLLLENGGRLIISGEDAITDLNRFEAFDNASNLTTEEDYETEAESILTQYCQNITFSGAGLVKSPYKFREQYDIGDIITAGFSDKRVKVQILSITEQWSWNSYTLSFSFGKPQNDLNRQLNLMFKKLQSYTDSSNAKTNSVKWYTTPTDTAQTEAETIYNTLGFTGSGGTFTLYHNGKTGSKNYHIYVKNLTDAVTLTTGSGTTVSLSAGTYVTIIFVDEDGNIIRSN